VRRPSHFGSYAQLVSSGTDVPEAASMGASLIPMILASARANRSTGLYVNRFVAFRRHDYHIE
jgi:hypothetical protein